MGQTVVERIRTDNVQRLVRSGFGRLPAATYVLFEIEDAAAARAWLGALTLTDAENAPERRAINLALTYAGLEVLGLESHALDGLAEELREGMVTEHRRRLLGDHDDSDPEGWNWGGPRDERPLHGVLLLYAIDGDELESHYAEQLAAMETSGVVEIDRLHTSCLPDKKEHFGFRDGIGQPDVLGIDDRGPSWNSIAPGEVLLGYRNQYDKLPRSPQVAAASPHLRGAGDAPGRDFGRDGSYLVMRQLAQDVPGFWNAAAEHSAKLRMEEVFPDCGSGAVMLASKLVGRWPSGAPLVRCPHTDDANFAEDDEFQYAAQDPDGIACSMGAHIRRANPRDWFLDGDANTSTRVANRHRIVRRGRAYGPPLAASMEVEALQQATEDGKARGLHFLCLNANIGRQFELVQHSWINGPKFGGLYASADPLMGDSIPETSARSSAASFEIPAPPIRLRVNHMRRFVRTRGGAYFFLPSLGAVQYLARLKPARAPSAR